MLTRPNTLYFEHPLVPGVPLDDKLNWSEQIKQVKCKLSYVGILNKVKQLLSRSRHTELSYTYLSAAVIFTGLVTASTSVILEHDRQNWVRGHRQNYTRGQRQGQNCIRAQIYEWQWFHSYGYINTTKI